MLLELHVRNLALIEKADVEFEEGLNILTGETGAGKSIIIGSVNMALGGKAQKDMIRTGAEYAYVELVFSVDTEEKREALKALDVKPDEDGILVVSKKIMPARSVNKVNDETVTVAKLRQITGLLIDIHGQHEHQSLLYHSKHLEILDSYGKSQIEKLKQETAEVYKKYRKLSEVLEENSGGQENRAREADFLRFEIGEIEDAELKPGEEEELTAAYRKFANGKKIQESLEEARDTVQNQNIGLAVRRIEEAARYDEALNEMKDQMFDVDALLTDLGHELTAYLDQMEFDEERFIEIEERLDLIHNLQAKYGDTLELIEKKLAEKRERLEVLEHFDEYILQTEKELEEATKKLEKLCRELSKQRKQAAAKLAEQIAEGLKDLNFLDVVFTMEFRRLDHFTAGGYDEAEFMISTNPGEPVRPLGMVASGGELSRIMLAVKTVLADSDDIPSLIFDEIDTGISGRTAQMVSQKLAIIAKTHQVICITHLPQIAAMADCHFEIAKGNEEGRTTTRICSLKEEEMVKELARLLGGAKITEAVLKNAREMKELAKSMKQQSGQETAKLSKPGERL